MKKYEVNRSLYQDKFCTWLRAIGFDGIYGHHEHFKYNKRLSGYKIGSIIVRPFNWSYDITRPNFENTETGFKMWWYKYPLRSAQSNIKVINKAHFLKLIGAKGF